MCNFGLNKTLLQLIYLLHLIRIYNLFQYNLVHALKSCNRTRIRNLIIIINHLGILLKIRTNDVYETGQLGVVWKDNMVPLK